MCTHKHTVLCEPIDADLDKRGIDADGSKRVFQRFPKILLHDMRRGAIAIILCNWIQGCGAKVHIKQKNSEELSGATWKRSQYTAVKARTDSLTV
jgi:hypothetical protein